MAEESHQRLPCLMLPSSWGHPVYGDFYSIFSRNVHSVDLIQLCNKRCVGSCNGWVIMVDEHNPSIVAVNPLKTSVWIHLPSLMSFPDIIDFNPKTSEYLYLSSALGSTQTSSEFIKDTYIKKIFLSEDPIVEGCMAVAIFGELKQLAYCKVGDGGWTIIPQQDFINNFLDVTFDQRGRFYALTWKGVVVTGDLRTPSFELVYTPTKPNFADRKYLVFDHEGRLMMINRYIGCHKNYDEFDESDNEFYDKTSKFTILGLDTKTGKVLEVASLGGGVLFLGDNESLYISSAEARGCAPDRVYFTDDSLFAHIEPRIGGHDIGVFFDDKGTRSR